MCPPMNSTKNKMDKRKSDQLFFFADDSNYILKAGTWIDELSKWKMFYVQVYDWSEELLQTVDLKEIQLEVNENGEITNAKMFDIATISPDGWFICFYYMEDRYNYDPPVQVFVYKIGKI